MSKEWFGALKPHNAGISRESVFVARLPNLTNPSECKRHSLDWAFANLSEIGGSNSLHATDEADERADADLGEFGRILKRIRAEMKVQANEPTSGREYGRPDDVELPSPVRSLGSVIERPEDAGILLRAIAVGKFRGPYIYCIKIRDLFEKVLMGTIPAEEVELHFAEPGRLRDDLHFLLELRQGLPDPDVDPRPTLNAVMRTLEMARNYLPDDRLAHQWHCLQGDEEDMLDAVLALTYGRLEELYLLNTMVPWTCDAPFFAIAPAERPSRGAGCSAVRFNVGVQLSSGIYLTSSNADRCDPGAFFAAGRANPLYASAQWLISPEPLEEVTVIVSSRPWERPVPAPGSIEEYALSVHGWGRVPVTLYSSGQAPRHWTENN
ncbi:MAG: hypothetical protein D9V44_08470 [Actinobacteria bacterium]|nr:MAG: hypothetical protein D9V44_08470 [Actinomycetota bacterium]